MLLNMHFQRLRNTHANLFSVGFVAPGSQGEGIILPTLQLAGRCPCVIWQAAAHVFACLIIPLRFCARSFHPRPETCGNTFASSSFISCCFLAGELRPHRSKCRAQSAYHVEPPVVQYSAAGEVSILAFILFHLVWCRVLVRSRCRLLYT